MRPTPLPLNDYTGPDIQEGRGDTTHLEPTHAYGTADTPRSGKWRI